jgi:hypothetical protein
MTEVPVTARLEEATVTRLERIGEALAKRASGATFKRGTVVRVVIERGLTELEAELGLSKKKR